VASLSLDARKWRWLLSTLCKSKPGTWVYKFCVRKRVGEKCKQITCLILLAFLLHKLKQFTSCPIPNLRRS
jgi:hypothetical protein